MGFSASQFDFCFQFLPVTGLAWGTGLGKTRNIGLANFNAASSTFSQKNTSRAIVCMDTLPQSSVLKFHGIRRQRTRGFRSLTEAETESSPGFDTRWICTLILSQVPRPGRLYFVFDLFFVVVVEYCLLNHVWKKCCPRINVMHQERHETRTRLEIYISFHSFSGRNKMASFL